MTRTAPGRPARRRAGGGPILGRLGGPPSPGPRGRDPRRRHWQLRGFTEVNLSCSESEFVSCGPAVTAGLQ